MQEIIVGDVFSCQSGRFEVTIEAIREGFCDYLMHDSDTGVSRFIENSSLAGVHMSLNTPSWNLKTLDLENE